jgi:site-specific recombinase XerD
VDLPQLEEDWLAAKRAMESAAQATKGNSDRARRADLERWHLVLGKDLGGLTTSAIIAGVGRAKARWSDATVTRMLSTLRGFTRWLHRGSHIPADPMADDLLRAPPRAQRRPKAITEAEVARLIEAAAEAPNPGTRMWWPRRDVALMRFMASTGARAEEVCTVRTDEVDRRAEHPIWRVNTAKGGKTRDVPLPRATVHAIDAYLEERQRADALFVRTDGTALSEQALDRIIRGLARRAGVVFPNGAAAHAFRHQYGVTLALRGVPPAIISQLMGHADPRTTAIYTTVAASQLIGALDDAGLL